KHIPDFLVIARKKAKWDWIVLHNEALQLLIFEASTYQSLGPIHPSDPVHTEWGFSSSGLPIHLRQKGPHDPTRPIRFYSRRFKDVKKQYSTWEKGLFVVSTAFQEAEKTIQKHSLILRGSFKVIKSVLAGTLPPDEVAQHASVRIRYTQIEHYCTIFRVTEGTPKNLPLQDEVTLTSTIDSSPFVIQVAPPYSEQLQDMWFTDASAKKLVTEGEGSAQVRELVAIWTSHQENETPATPLSENTPHTRAQDLYKEA
ncbi:hypothetical protein HGM15179_019548, partial [Zosterops borbonicus]